MLPGYVWYPKVHLLRHKMNQKNVYIMNPAFDFGMPG